MPAVSALVSSDSKGESSGISCLRNNAIPPLRYLDFGVSQRGHWNGFGVPQLLGRILQPLNSSSAVPVTHRCPDISKTHLTTTVSHRNSWAAKPDSAEAPLTRATAATNHLHSL